MIQLVHSVTSGKVRSPRMRRGFTLIEMLLALGIFVLVITSITPVFFSTQDRLGLESKAKEIGAVIFDTRTRSLQGFGDGTKAVLLSTNEQVGAGEITITNETFEDIKNNPSIISSQMKKEYNVLSSAVGEKRASSTPFYKIDTLTIPGASTSSPDTIAILFEPVSSNTYIYANGSLLQDVSEIQITLSSIVRPHIKRTLSINPMTGITQ